MSDFNRQWKDVERRVEQVEVIERPGVTGYSTFYASGSWTPAFGGTSTDGTISYDTQNGIYWRIGKLCIARYHVNTNTVTSKPTGNLQLTGLPFTAVTVATVSPGGNPLADYSNIDLSAGYTQAGLRVVSNATRATLTQSGDNIGAAFIAGTAMTGNDVEITGILMYEVA